MSRKRRESAKRRHITATQKQVEVSWQGKRDIQFAIRKEEILKAWKLGHYTNIAQARADIRECVEMYG